MPWHNGTIYLVTPGYHPHWLDLGRVTLVNQSSLLPPDTRVMNSNAIEQNFDRIPGLTDHFIHMNDDYMMTSPVYPWDFFYPDGVMKLFMGPHATSFTSASLRAEGNLSKNIWKAATAHTWDLVDRAYGTTPHYLLSHSPFVYHKAVFRMVRRKWPQETAATAKSPFRNYNDVIFPLLHHALVRFDPAAEALRGAVPAADEIRYHHQYVSYRNTAEAVEQRLVRVLRMRPKFVTVNGACNVAASLRIFTRFLRRLYPTPSDFEIMGSDVELHTAAGNGTKSDGRPLRVPEADPAYDPVLPPGIEMTWDTGSHRYYYWNVTSRVKSWSLPYLLGKQRPRRDPVPDAGSDLAITPNATASLDRSADRNGTRPPVVGAASEESPAPPPPPSPQPFSLAPDPNAASGASNLPRG